MCKSKAPVEMIGAMKRRAKIDRATGFATAPSKRFDASYYSHEVRRKIAQAADAIALREFRPRP